MHMPIWNCIYFTLISVLSHALFIILLLNRISRGGGGGGGVGPPPPPPPPPHNFGAQFEEVIPHMNIVNLSTPTFFNIWGVL